MFCEFASDKPTLFSCNLKYIFWLCFINLETKALLIWRKVGGPQGALPPEPTLPHIYMEKIGTQGVHVSIVTYLHSERTLIGSSYSPRTFHCY